MEWIVGIALVALSVLIMIMVVRVVGQNQSG